MAAKIIPVILCGGGERGCGAGGSITFLFQRLPNVTLAFDISTYVDAYSGLNGSDSGRINTAGFALDFSK